MNNNQVKAANFSFAQAALMLLFNSIPFLHVLLVVLLVVFPWERLWIRCLAGLGCLYIVPPLLVRIIGWIMPIRKSHISVGSREYFTWWTMLNLQMVFCRIPVLEELLRLIPGLYSNWLRLWGAKIGRLTYWAAGTAILDRQYLQIGNNVVFGAAVRLNPHVLIKNDQGKLELLLAPVKIGDNAIIGGYSLLSAGTEIAAGECTRAFLISPPFSRWQNHERSKNESAV